MKTAIVNFKAYLQRRYPDRSTSKHYISDLTIFSQFVGKKSPRDISVKTIDAFANEAVPEPYNFDDWQEWAEAVVNAVNPRTN